MPNKIDEAYQKAARYCSYQERTEQEVRNKLQALGVTQKGEKEQLVQVLKAAHFLDERRYVEAFIRGKVVGKQWGKKKLFITLANKGLDRALIRKGLDAIEDADYLRSLHKAAEQKERSLAKLAERDPVQYKQKLTNYLLQKGYEPEWIYQVVQE